MHALLAVALALTAAAPVDEVVEGEVILDPVEIRLPRAFGAARPSAADLAARKAVTSDSTDLLRGVPGVTVSGAGGISSLPAIHGLADDRLRVQVDGADLMPACPNHMNAPLSYADPARVESVTVFSGATPVSVGGDSLGGSIQVRSRPPDFATPAEGVIARGALGGFVRSDGGAYGYTLGAAAAGTWLHLAFSQSSAWSGNVVAGGAFKPAAPGREDGPTIPSGEIGSSAYRDALKRSLGLALRSGPHLLQLEGSQQTIGFEGFPNQRMDMTANDNRSAALRYTGRAAWGLVEARLDYQTTRHEMDMGPDRFSYGTGMPMDTRAKTRGALLKATFTPMEGHVLRAGVEWQYHTLFDWWPPVGGSMGPNAFWNVDLGERRKLDAYAEWEARWGAAWTSLVGLRSDTVTSDAAPVQGYDNGLAAAWGDDAARFNASRRRRTDWNWDLTASGRFTPDLTQAYEAGYARKSRSPGLYQRYPWSTNAMAALMNNTVGDGNGYVGDVGLRPEVAHTLSASGDWHDEARRRWGLTVAAHFSQIADYVDARRCDFGQCSAANATATTGFVLLQYVNRTARILGVDVSGRATLVEEGRLGSLVATTLLSALRGDNLSTGDGLFGIMPPSATTALVHRLGGWSTTAELVAVASKTHVSRVRNEVPTGGYALGNLRGSFEWAHGRVDVSVENLLDRLYSNPLGGAYVGQGASMSSTGIRWGVPVPGPGRSLNAALNLRF